MTDIITGIYIINFVCQDHFSKNGYTYPVSPNIPPAVLQNKDCEKAWYWKAPGDGSELEYLSDGQLHVNQSRHPLVVDVSEKNITITKCVELRHNVTCHGSNQKFQHLYQVTDHNAINSTSSHNAINSTSSHNAINSTSSHNAINSTSSHNAINSTSSHNAINSIAIAFPIIITIIITIIIIIVGIPLKDLEAGSNHEMQPLNIDNPNRDHAVSADQNGDAVRMSIQDQTSESDEGPRLLSNQNNADCATVNMNGYENDGMKKCTVEDQTAEDDRRWSSVDSRPEFPACPDPAPHIDDIITNRLYKEEEEGAGC
ncbi:uncharacterized protein LOC113650433 isoform X2 [Tachysurus fulvidraco]|uniref:uncharacterized protein LOC113650433 isoform X2 n=1 Tax=Tachysurus fulvidraco TaxID=1234273 RepID=UPI001FED769B|nr:uncharacterized protein LOC113650433 isoform X2 [Tachysurus fulvidraco]